MRPSVRCSATYIGCEFKLAVLTYRCLRHISPMNSTEWRTDLRRRLRSASTSTLVVPPMRQSTIGDCATPLLVTAHFRSRLRAYGTACRLALPRRDVSARTVSDDSALLYSFLCVMFDSDCGPFYCKVFLQSQDFMTL